MHNSFVLIKKKFSSKSGKSLLENFFSLSLLQVANYVIPLITLPYLTRVLGPEKFGLTAFAQAIMAYFTILTDFGFNLSATKSISIHRNDPGKISQIYSSVFIIRLPFLVLSFLILVLLIQLNSGIGFEKKLFYYSFPIVVGNAFFPQWFYQGIEKMKFISIFTISSRVLFSIFVFILIKSPADYVLYQLIYAVAIFVAGLTAFIYAFFLFRLKLILPPRSVIKDEFVKGWHIFVSTFSTSLYTTSNTVFLGFLTSSVTVGYYSAIEKIFRAFQYLGLPIFQVIFPHYSKLIVDDRERALRHFRKLFKMIMLATFILSLFISLFAGSLIKVALGPTYKDGTVLLILLSWVLFASRSAYYLGVQGLVSFGYEEIFSKILSILGIVHLILVYFGIKMLGVIAVPIVWMFTESSISFFEYAYLKKKHILP